MLWCAACTYGCHQVARMQRCAHAAMRACCCVQHALNHPRRALYARRPLDFKDLGDNSRTSDACRARCLHTHSACEQQAPSRSISCTAAGPPRPPGLSTLQQCTLHSLTTSPARYPNPLPHPCALAASPHRLDASQPQHATLSPISHPRALPAASPHPSPRSSPTSSLPPAVCGVVHRVPEEVQREDQRHPGGPGRPRHQHRRQVLPAANPRAG